MSTRQTRGLGRGLETLIPVNFDSSLLADKSERIEKLAIENISPNPQQPRKSFDAEALNELSDSIKNYGLLQPIIVTPTSENRYLIVAGERRWRAARLAGFKTIPAIVRSSQKLEQLEVALVENVQRVDLSPLEQAVSIERLHEQFNLEYAEIAQKLGKAPSTVQNIARLLKLPKSAKQALQEGKITEGHARAILALSDEVAQSELLRLIEAGGWSVRQAERYVNAHKAGVKRSEIAQKRVHTITPESKALAKHLGTPVHVRRMAKGGRLEITFTSESNLKQIIKKLLK